MARYDDGALCTDGTIPGTGYTPTEYRQRTDKRRKQPPTGDRTDTTPGTGHRGGGPRRDHPTGPDNPNLIAAQHLAPLTAAIDNGWPVFVPQAYTPYEFCKNDRLTVQGLACIRALEDRPSNTPDPHTIAQTCGIVLTACGAADAGLYLTEGNYQQAAIAGILTIPGLRIIQKGAQALKALRAARATETAVKTEISAASRLATVGGCFVAGTQVLVVEGTSKAIEDVKVGDKVTSFNSVAGRREVQSVTQKYVHAGVATFDVVVKGQRVTTTAEHPFYVVSRSWIPAKNLKHGVGIRSWRGRSAWTSA